VFPWSQWFYQSHHLLLCFFFSNLLLGFGISGWVMLVSSFWRPTAKCNSNTSKNCQSDSCGPKAKQARHWDINILEVLWSVGDGHSFHYRSPMLFMAGAPGYIRNKFLFSITSNVLSFQTAFTINWKSSPISTFKHFISNFTAPSLRLRPSYLGL
jgi:hypothetical protein